MSSTDKVLGTIGALNTLIENFPMSILDLLEGKRYTSIFDFLVDVLLACGVPLDKAVEWLIKNVFSVEVHIDKGLDKINEALARNGDYRKREESGWMRTFEVSIKTLLMTLLTSLYRCSSIPIIPNKVLDYPDPSIFSGSTKENKKNSEATNTNKVKLWDILWRNQIYPARFDIPAKMIDPMGMLSISPATQEGRLFYDVDGYDVYYRKKETTVPGGINTANIEEDIKLYFTRTTEGDNVYLQVTSDEDIFENIDITIEYTKTDGSALLVWDASITTTNKLSNKLLIKKGNNLKIGKIKRIILNGELNSCSFNLINSEVRCYFSYEKSEENIKDLENYNIFENVKWVKNEEKNAFVLGATTSNDDDFEDIRHSITLDGCILSELSDSELNDLIIEYNNLIEDESPTNPEELPTISELLKLLKREQEYRKTLNDDSDNDFDGDDDFESIREHLEIEGTKLTDLTDKEIKGLITNFKELLKEKNEYDSDYRVMSDYLSLLEKEQEYRQNHNDNFNGDDFDDDDFESIRESTMVNGIILSELSDLEIYDLIEEYEELLNDNDLLPTEEREKVDFDLKLLRKELEYRETHKDDLKNDSVGENVDNYNINDSDFEEETEDTYYFYETLSEKPKDFKKAKRMAAPPTTANKNTPDLVVVFEGVNPNELYKTYDMNAFIWYTLNRSIRATQIDINHTMWDSRLKMYRNLERDLTVTELNDWYNSKKTAKDEFLNILNTDSSNPLNYRTLRKDVLYPILQLKKAPNNLYGVSVSFPSQTYYKPTFRKRFLNKNGKAVGKIFSFNSTIYEFNWNYLNSIQILKPRLLLANFINYLVGGIMNEITNTEFNITQKIIKNKISTAAKKIIEADDSEIEDCFSTFSNDEFDAMLEDMLLSRYDMTYYGGNEAKVKTHDVDSYIASLDGINASTSREGSITKTVKLIEDVSAAPAVAGAYSFGFEHSFDKNAIIKKLIWALVMPIIDSLFTPQVMMLIIINMSLSGAVKMNEFGKNDFGALLNLILNKIMGLIKSIIKFVKEKVAEMLFQFILKEIMPLIVKWMAALKIEELKNWLNILIAAVKCLPTMDIKLPKLGGIDDVNYADIIDTGSTTTPEAASTC